MILLGYLYETFSFSRIWIGFLFIFSVFFMILSRYTIYKFTNKIVKKLGLSSRTLIVGTNEEAKRIKESLEEYKAENFNIIGFVEKSEKLEKLENNENKFNILGSIDNLGNLVLQKQIKKIIIVTKDFDYFEILNILEELKSLDVLVLLSPGYFEFSIGRVKMRDIAGIPLLQVSKVGFFGIDLFLKHLIDYALGIILFIIFIFLYLIIALNYN